MTIGSKQDMFFRFKKDLAPWFGNDTPVLNALIAGVAETDSYIYGLIDYVNLQTRIKTATDINLDYISKDFFGDELPRKTGENDASFRNRILANLLVKKATRYAIANIIFNLTGIEPVMIEGFSPLNAGAYDATLYYDEGYGISGGAPNEAYTGMIYAFLPQPKGFFAVSGIGMFDGIASNYSGGYWGYDFHFNNTYIDVSQEIIFVSTADVVNVIKSSKVYGTSIYLYIDGIPYAGNPI